MEVVLIIFPVFMPRSSPSPARRKARVADFAYARTAPIAAVVRPHTIANDEMKFRKVNKSRHFSHKNTSSMGRGIRTGEMENQKEIIIDEGVG